MSEELKHMPLLPEPSVLNLFSMQGKVLQTVDIGFIKAGQSRVVELRTPSSNNGGMVLYNLRVGDNYVTGKLVQIF